MEGGENKCSEDEGDTNDAPLREVEAQRESLLGASLDSGQEKRRGG
jgi:hypothetical protein